ncbi:glycosyltransferase family 4 protein [Psychroflexus halocasei]|uniref:Glycosyltransferase involved in cell wall bisynthesis n=1 Tax=Psychroflexus halocasei TaxID=908615 RepID=A0A1H4BMT8_9FLAO|nr:glycosyltransferase family 4 protein [Psychroflexus halocasei]SEA49397.1 Glycosyltransferase involved in cell wall bisynthesis [Psychroflexus halocasei]
MGSKNKDILIVSNYFPPETGAASNRIFSLAEKLSKHQYNVKVISPLPNYPHGKVLKTYRGKFKVKETFKSIDVTRLFVVASKSSNKIIRLLSSLSFAITLFFYILFAKTPNRFIIQCSPLFVGFLAVLACKLKNKEIILNVSDLWPLAGLEMGILNDGFYYRILQKMESFIYKNSKKIIGQSNEILSHIKRTANCDDKFLFLYRNFPQFKRPELVSSSHTSSTRFRIVYAGLIGVAQGIETICKEVNFPSQMEFHIYGDGPMTQDLKEYINNKENIFYHGSLKREELHHILMTYDATLIPLKNRIFGSVPSKIFEYAKLGLPIIYFSDGEGANIVEDLNLGVAIREINYQLLENQFIKILNQKEVLPSKKEVLEIAEHHFNLEKQFNDFDRNCLN